MYNPNTNVYVPGNYFGESVSKKFKINTEKTLIVGCIIKKLNMSGHIWYQVYFFLTYKKLWIDANHLIKLPINSNIIYGKTYLNELNKKDYEIKKNIFYNPNILTEKAQEIKDYIYTKNNINNCQNEYIIQYKNKYRLSHSSNIRYKYFS